jgi:hypothetical protein
MNKIFLEHWLNKYEEQAEKIDEHLRSIYRMGIDMYRLENSACLEQKRLDKKLDIPQAEFKQMCDRIRKFREKAKDIERKRWNAKFETDVLISERERIERKIQHFVNTTKDFEIRDKRFAKVRARELCEKYE